MDIPLHVLDKFPIWGLFIMTILAFLAFIEAGFRLSNRNILSIKEAQKPQINAIMGTTLGLLTFLLAFTFAKAEMRFATKKLMVVDTVNAIGTAYLRADLLLAPDSSQAKKLLREYTEVNIQAPRYVRLEQLDKLQQAISQGIKIESLLWKNAVVVAQHAPDKFTVELYVQSLNNLFDIRTRRVWVALLNRISITIWGTLYFIAFLAMSVLGYHAGLTGKRNPAATVALVLTFSAVLLLVIDLDRSHTSLFKGNHQMMIQLLKTMNATDQ